MLQEWSTLNASVEHIKAIVSMQQKHAWAVGAVEEIAVSSGIMPTLELPLASRHAPVVS